MKKIAFLIAAILTFVSCNNDEDVTNPSIKIPSMWGDADLSTVGKPIDLGLSVDWADRNIGAKKPESFGAYFAWGEIGEKSTYTISNCKWYEYDTHLLLNASVIKRDYSLTTRYDAASANWGEDWRMPTAAELKELVENTTSEWKQINGVRGRMFTSKKNGKSIFLPAAGSRFEGGVDDANSSGNYWCSAAIIHSCTSYHNACGLSFDWYDTNYETDFNKINGQSIRPVAFKK